MTLHASDSNHHCVQFVCSPNSDSMCFSWLLGLSLSVSILSHVDLLCLHVPNCTFSTWPGPRHALQMSSLLVHFCYADLYCPDFAAIED